MTTLDFKSLYLHKVKMRLKTPLFNILTIISLSFFASACKNDPPQYKNGKTTFFDLKTYFKTEIARLKTDVKQVKKTVTVNGKSEEKILDSLNFEEELAPFVASDINRPAWSDYYMNKNEPQGIESFRDEYYALKDHLKTRSMIIDKKGSNTTINILNAEETVATKAETRLIYNNNSGYTISTTQKLMGSEDSVKVNVQFIEK